MCVCVIGASMCGYMVSSIVHVLACVYITSKEYVHHRCVHNRLNAVCALYVCVCVHCGDAVRSGQWGRFKPV